MRSAFSTNKSSGSLENIGGNLSYYDPLLGHSGFSSDGVDMKRSGYLIMEIALLRTVPDA